MTVLSARALGRATLARQHLLTPTSMPVLDLVEHLYGLQAQAPMAPYFALRSRLKSFRPEQLSQLLLDRSVVRIVTMRGTVHLLTGTDALALRPLVQPVMDRDLVTNTQHAAALAGIDFEALAAAGRRLVDEQPRTAAQLRTLLAPNWPDRAPESLAHAIRDLLPLVQVPPRGVWGKAGQPTLTTLGNWVGRESLVDPDPGEMVLRYLAAYGPATVKDVQAWSGLTRLGEVVERLRPGLMTFATESGAELFDLPDAPRPDAGVPAPVRILAPFDNVLLSYADRTRVISDEHRKVVFTINGIIKPAVLVNGVVAGLVSDSATKTAAVLEVTLFSPVSKTYRSAVEREGLKLLKFAHPDRESYDVRIS